MIRTNTPRSFKTSVSKTNFQTDTPTARKKLITYIWYVSSSPRAEMNKESKPKSHTRGPSIKFLLLLHSPLASEDRFYYFTKMNDHTKRYIPSVTTKTHTQAYVRTHARTRPFAQTHASIQTHTHTHTNTHTFTHAREYKNKRFAYTVFRPHLLKHTNFKST